mgnify:CR=1 FL=1
MEISLCENIDPLFNIFRMVRVIYPSLDLSKVYNLFTNGLRKYLVVNDDTFYIITVVNDSFYSVDLFKVDEDSRIKYLSFHNSNICFRDDVAFSFSNDMTPIDDFDYYRRHFIGYVTNSVTVMKVDAIVDRYGSYNSIIYNLEYNLDKSLSLSRMYLYQANFDGTDRLNYSYCSHPFYLCVNDLKNHNTREFFLTQWNREMNYYGLALMKYVGLIDFMTKAQIDPETGDELPPFGVEGGTFDDVHEQYKKIKGDNIEKDAMFLIKANAPINTEAHAYVQTQLSSGKIKLLIDEREASTKLMSTKVGQNMTPEQRGEYLMPFTQTTILKEQLMNLIEENEGVNIILKQNNKSIKKDKFSAFEYGLYYIKVEEDNKKRKKKFNAKEWMFMN